MKKDLTISVSEKTYEQLINLVKGDSDNLQGLLEQAIHEWLEGHNKQVDEKSDASLNLEDYLKTSKSGSRSYGVKGQGW